jgi:7,8-dihydropterin-6-yl-methyl-4-(beta-D-ribofuranosyl)aminobenzene 5'-phosphate synthase
MRIINLIENTEGRSGCACAHGLSFYVETEKHKLLLDLGPSGETLKNAQALGIDLAKVDTVILSHGHYDHSGGIMPFAGINDQAVIYMQESATGEYYADNGSSAPERYEYIGIDKNIVKLPRVRFLQGDHRIDDELELFTIKNRSHKLPSSNKRILVRRGDHFQFDDFVHEQFLVIREGSKRVLMSGCAHSGILSIMDAFCDKYGKEPDLVISGFHLMKKTEYTSDEIREIDEIAGKLKKYSTRFITCHCTGLPAFDRMKEIMGDQLAYVHSGEEIDLSTITQSL